jgi:predicted transcriptional regulator
VGDIVNELPQHNLPSQHLKELKNAGLIKGNFEGNAICYCLDEEGFNKIRGFFLHINTYLENKKINVVNFKLVEKKLSEKKLDTLENVTFQLPDGTTVPEHFHVTEVGLITKNFIDCGGK